MPVRFQGSSEYARNYQWHEYYKNRNNSSTGQIGHIAGQTSDKLGLVTEPPLQYRKMIENDYRQPLPDRDDYILLGDQSKFASSVKYPLKYFKSYNNDQQDLRNPAAYDDNNRALSPPKRSPPPAPRPADLPSKKHTIKAATYQNAQQSRPKKPHQTVQIRTEKPIAKETEKPSYQPGPAPKPSGGKPQRTTVNSRQQEKVDHYVQTNLDLQSAGADNRPPVDADYAMKYKAKIAPPRTQGPKRMSEYQMQYKWHENINSSPLLAAEQVVYKSHPVLSGAKDFVQKESEYRLQFKPWKFTPVEKKSAAERQLRERSKSLESLHAAGAERKIPPDNRRLIKESLNPTRPFFPHGKLTTYQTEYQKNFKAFSDYEYENGAWQGGHQRPQTAQPESRKPSTEPEKVTKVTQRPVSASVPSGASAHTDRSWYAEVVELRNRAAEYRQRARGTHFSREHLAQLYARQADLWDTVSNSSNLSALSLEASKKSAVKSSPDRPPAGVRTAWDKVSTQPSSGAKEAGSAQTRVESSSSSVSSLSSSSSPSADPPPAPALPSTASSSTEGRVPTPKTRLQPTNGVLLRHHLDRTTPAVGGALLTSPPKKKPNSDEGSSPRHVPSQTQSEPGHANVQSQSHQASRSSGLLYGLPTRDTHLLVDETASEDRALETHYTRSPPQTSNTIARRLEYREKHPELSIPSTIQEGGTTDYQNGLVDDNDDVLSVSARSVASSSSLASEVLERARNRRDDFWGKSTNTGK